MEYSLAVREQYHAERRKTNPKTGKPNSIRRSCKNIGVSRDCGRRWEKRLNETGMICSARDAGECDSKLVSIWSEIESLLVANPSTSTNQLVEFGKKHNITLDRSNYKRTLNRQGFYHNGQGWFLVDVADGPAPTCVGGGDAVAGFNDTTLNQVFDDTKDQQYSAVVTNDDVASTLGHLTVTSVPSSDQELEETASLSKAGDEPTGAMDSHPLDNVQEQNGDFDSVAKANDDCSRQPDNVTKNFGGRPCHEIESHGPELLELVKTHPTANAKTLEKIVQKRFGFQCSDTKITRFLAELGPQLYQSNRRVALPIDRFGVDIQQWIDNDTGIQCQTILSKLKHEHHFHCSFLMLRLYLQQRGLFDRVSITKPREYLQPFTSQERAAVIAKAAPVAQRFCDLMNPFDTRRSNAKKNRLGPTLFLMFLATLCGYGTIKGTVIFAQFHYHILKSVIPDLPKYPPSETTIRDAILLVQGNAQPIIETLLQFSYQLPEEIDGFLVINIDGKTLCGSKDPTNGIKPQHVVEAMTQQNRQTVSMIPIDCVGKEKKVPVALMKNIMANPDFADKKLVVTLDAGFSFVENFIAIEEAGHIFFNQIKGNQKFFKIDLQQLINDLKPYDTHYSEDFSRCRRVTRTTEVYNGRYIEEKYGWVGATVGRITINRNGHIRHHYYITNHAFTAKQVAHLAREHWSIEVLHWWLDNIFREDEYRGRRGKIPAISSAINRAATNKLFSHQTNLSPSDLLQYASMDIHILLDIISS